MTSNEIFRIIAVGCGVYVWLLTPIAYKLKRWLKGKRLKAWLYNLPYCEKCLAFWSGLIITGRLDMAVVTVVFTKLILRYV